MSSKNFECFVCKKTVSKVISFDNSMVCTSCIKKIAKKLEEQEVEKQIEEVTKDISNPKEIIKALNDHIIGQKDAKRILSIAAFNHKIRVEHNTKCKEENKVDELIEKSNIILLGPTGVGKTATLKQLSRLLDVPFVICDSTGLTSAGYAGKDVDTILDTLVQNANGNVELAEKGIVFIDEFDKLSRKSGHMRAVRDVGGEGVQQALLKMIEGTDFVVNSNPRISNGTATSGSYTINTDDILFIMGGAFEGLKEQIDEDKSEGSSIGFSMGNDDCLIVEVQEEDQVTTEDLRKYGILPEILGRAPVICEFKELTREELKRILTEPKNSVIKQMTRLTSLSNVDLIFKEDALDEIVDMAIKKKTGARGLRGIVENIMEDVFIEIPNPLIDKVIITKDAIKNKTPEFVTIKEEVN